MDRGILSGWYGTARDINSHAWVQWAGTAQAQTIILHVLEGANGVDAVCL